MKKSLGKALHLIGNALAILGLGAVVFHVHGYWEEIDFSQVSGSLRLFFVALILGYGIANLLLAAAWWSLLRRCGGQFGVLGAIRIYGGSQLAKYLPGNIFHLAGRQVLGLAAGIPAAPLAKSIFYELVLTGIVGSTFLVFLVPNVFPSISAGYGVVLFAVVISLMSLSLYKLGTELVAFAFTLQLVFLLFSGILFTVLVCLLAQPEGDFTHVFLQYGTIYIAAWLAGFVTPGAPAGIGVREWVILHFNSGFVGVNELLLLIVVARLITVLGDLFFYFISKLVGGNIEEKPISKRL